MLYWVKNKIKLFICLFRIEIKNCLFFSNKTDLYGSVVGASPVVVKAVEQLSNRIRLELKLQKQLVIIFVIFYYFGILN